MKVIKQKDSLGPRPSTADSISFGQCFTRNNCGIDIFMRVKPTTYLLNSTLITDCINRSKVLVVNIEKGTCFFIEGSELVWPIEVSAVIKERG